MELRGRKYVGWDSREGPAVPLFTDWHFQSCAFEYCRIATASLRASERLNVANCSVRQSSLVGCGVDRVVLSDVVVTDVTWPGLLQVWATAFRRVTLAGRLGRLMISNDLGLLDRQQEQRQFYLADEFFYRETDWALDISSAEFGELDVRGIPARLIRRDPETQAVVRAERARRGDWKHVDLTGSYWDGYISGMLERGATDVVLAAPRASRRFKANLQALRRLRDAGIAE